MEKGDIYWADLRTPDARGEAGFRRPVLIVQSDIFNRSAIPTVLVAPLTANLRRAKAPGNVRLSAEDTGLPEDSVVVVSQIVSIARSRLDKHISTLDPSLVFLVDNGIRLVFDV